MELRKAILKKAANAGANIPVFVHKLGFDADNESVAIVETEKGDIVTVFAEEIQFDTIPIIVEKKRLSITLKERNDKIDDLIATEFEDKEDEELKKEFRTGFRNCWGWLREKGVL